MVIECLSHAPLLLGHETLTQRKYEQQSIKKDKLFFDPVGWLVP